MLRKLLLSLFVVMSLAGCASTQQQATINQLQMRLGELERRIALKDDEIDGLKYDVDLLNQEIKSLGRIRQQARKAAEVIKIERTKQDGAIRVDTDAGKVQIALKKAGYYSGAIDSKVGNGTKEAIKSFQKDHGLKIDGIIGQQTWTELRSYLE